MGAPQQRAARVPKALRVPKDAAEQRECIRAYESGDPLAIARWERPGCNYLLVEDARTAHPGQRFVIAVPPGAKPFDATHGSLTAHLAAMALEKGDVAHIVRVDDATAHVGTERPAA